MTSAERVALERALLSHPNIRERVGKPWRVKRLEPNELRRLAAEMGVDIRPVIDRLDEQRRRWQVPTAASPKRTSTAHRGSFTGVLRFPMKLDLLGVTVAREARVTWGYTPAWEHIDRARRRIVVGAPEEYSLSFEVKAVPDREALVIDADERPKRRPLLPFWTPLDLLGDGILPGDLNDKIERLIDEDARRQNEERLRACGFLD